MEDLRTEIDGIDEKIVALLQQRFEITRKVGEHKAENSMPAIDPSREEEQFRRAELLADEYGLDRDMLKKILRIIIDKVVEDHEEVAKGNSAEG